LGFIGPICNSASGERKEEAVTSFIGYFEELKKKETNKDT
jgi:hypothetical protein